MSRQSQDRDLSSAISELMRITQDWDRAMTTNDAQAIGKYMAEDWTIVGSDGGTSDKASFLALIESGALSHDVMETHEPDIRVYGDAAVIVSRGLSGGEFRGRAFLEAERVSSVFVRVEGEWQCVLTHLSRLAPESSHATNVAETRDHA